MQAQDAAPTKPAIRRGMFTPTPEVTGEAPSWKAMAPSFDLLPSAMTMGGPLDAPESMPAGGMRVVEIEGMHIGVGHIWREPVVWPQVSTPPKYQATLGKRPYFCSQHDADEYDRGYRWYAGRVKHPVPFAGTPRRQGWDDAQADQHALNALRAVERG